MKPVLLRLDRFKLHLECSRNQAAVFFSSKTFPFILLLALAHPTNDAYVIMALIIAKFVQQVVLSFSPQFFSESQQHPDILLYRKKNCLSACVPLEIASNFSQMLPYLFYVDWCLRGFGDTTTKFELGQTVCDLILDPHVCPSFAISKSSAYYYSLYQLNRHPIDQVYKIINNKLSLVISTIIL